MNSILEYMKAVVEGRNNLEPFARWFHDNDAALQQMCSRGSYLRLKHNPIPEFKLLLLANSIEFVESEDAYLPSQPGNYSWIKSEWLTEPVFPYRQSPSLLCRGEVFCMDELLHMIHIKQTGDELRRFNTPPETWANRMGRSGIALVRDGKVIYAIVLMMN